MRNPKMPYHQLADVDLFSLVKQDDTSAFEELYSRYWFILVNTAFRRLQTRQKAEDIVQNIFLDLYHRRSSIALTISLSAYLHQALKFKILNEFRSREVRAAYHRSFSISNTFYQDFSVELDAKETSRRIEKAVCRLPQKCQQVFVLSRRENLPNKAIATGLNISISTVEKHIGKALKTLRGSL